VLKWSALKRFLPDNVHLLTLEQWEAATLLLRLEHFYAKDEDPVMSQPAKVQLKVNTIFTSCQHQRVDVSGPARNHRLQEETTMSPDVMIANDWNKWLTLLNIWILTAVDFRFYSHFILFLCYVWATVSALLYLLCPILLSYVTASMSCFLRTNKWTWHIVQCDCYVWLLREQIPWTWHIVQCDCYVWLLREQIPWTWHIVQCHCYVNKYLGHGT